MIKMLIFFDPVTKTTITKNTPDCYCCSKKLDKHFYLAVWSKRAQPSMIISLCRVCIGSKKIANFGVVQKRSVTIVPRIPTTAYPFDPSNIMLSDGKYNGVTTFEAAEIPTQQTKDKTKIAGRVSWRGASIGAPAEKEKRMHTPKQVTKHLEDIRKG